METNPFPDLKIDSPFFLNDIKGRSQCPKCGKSRKFYCYSCYVPLGGAEFESKVPKIKLPVKIDIIKHPLEVDGKSTAVHAGILCPDDVTIYTYPTIPEYSNKDKVLLVFPGPESVTFQEYVSSQCHPVVSTSQHMSQAGDNCDSSDSTKTVLESDSAQLNLGSSSKGCISKSELPARPIEQCTSLLETEESSKRQGPCGGIPDRMCSTGSAELCSGVEGSGGRRCGSSDAGVSSQSESHTLGYPAGQCSKVSRGETAGGRSEQGTGAVIDGQTRKRCIETNNEVKSDTAVKRPRSDREGSHQIGIRYHPNFDRVVFIDSTWHTVNKICMDERLAGLQRIELKLQKTKFWRYQLDKPDTYLSTIEAVYYFLREYHTCFIGQDYSGGYDNLLFYFVFMYDKIRQMYEGGKKLKAYSGGQTGQS